MIFNFGLLSFGIIQIKILEIEDGSSVDILASWSLVVDDSSKVYCKKLINFNLELKQKD